MGLFGVRGGKIRGALRPGVREVTNLAGGDCLFRQEYAEALDVIIGLVVRVIFTVHVD